MSRCNRPTAARKAGRWLFTISHIRSGPYPIGLDLRVPVNDDVPRAYDLAPRDIRRQVPGLLAQLARSFANDLDVSFDGGLQILVAEKACEINP